MQGCGSGTGIVTIKTETESTHIELTFGEMLDSSTVVHVAQDLVLKGCLEFLAGYVELLELHSREIVEVVAVGTHEM